MKTRRLLWSVLLGLLLAGFVRSAAAEDLPKQWSVGQEGVTPKDLTVTTPPPAPAELSIQEAVATALRYNVGFRQTINSLLTSNLGWWVAKQRWDLTLFGSVERTVNDATANSAAAGAALSYAALTGTDFSVTAELDKLDSEETAQTVAVTVRRPLLGGSGRASDAYEQLRRARTGYRSALLDFFVQEQGLVEQVIGSYFGAVEQQQLVDIQDASVRRAEESVEDARLRLEGGLIAEIDLTRAQLRLTQDQSAAVLRRQSMPDAMDQLMRVLGLQVGGMPKLVTTVSYQPKGLNLEAEVAQALERRPELRLSDLTIENRLAALRISRSRALPSLDIFGGWRDTRNTDSGQNWNVGLELSVPVASRVLRAAVQEAQWGLLLTRQLREDLKQDITAEVRSQVRAAEAARSNVEIASQGVELAKLSVHFAQRLLEEGLRTNRDLLDAQDDLTRSEVSLTQSKISYYLSTVRLRRAVGLDVAQDLPTERAPPAPATPPEAPKP